MSKYIESLLEQRKNVWGQATALLDQVATEGRALSAEETIKYDRMTADLEELRTRADKLVEDAANASKADEALRGLLAQTPSGPTPTSDSIEQELRKFISEEVRELDFGPKTSEEKRALSKGTATAGGNTVPTSFYNQLWTHLIETATLAGEGATIFTTDSGEALEIPVTTSHGAAAATPEGTVIGGTDPTFAKRTLNAYKYAQLIVLSRELLDDTGVDIESYIAQAVGWNLGNAIGAKWIAGAGGGTEPTGIVSGATTGVTGAAGVAGVPTLDNLIDLQYSVIAPYRKRPTAKWLFKDSTAAVLRKIKDTTGQYIWQPAVIAGQPDLLLGKPIATDPYMPAVGLGNKSVIFGDLSAYAIRVVNGIRFERSNEAYFTSDQIAFRAVIRGDGMLIDQTGAVKAFVGNAA